MKRIKYEMTITDLLNLYEELGYGDTYHFDQETMNLIDDLLNTSVDVEDIDYDVDGIYISDVENYLYKIIRNGSIIFEVTERDDLFRI